MSDLPNNSLRALLSDIVDYAGLFPPSKLPMAEAVKNYAAYRRSAHAWMLGRFVVPAARLDEFAESAKNYFSEDGESVWRLSVLAGEDVEKSLRQIENFNVAYSNYTVCDAIELKADAPAQIEAASDAIPRDFTNYFEIPIGENLADLVSTLAIYGQRAKIRTGGVTPDAFPKAAQIVRFVRTCLAANVPFKATAGLHHPVRCLKPLTYEKNAPEGMMFGFLNVFLASAFAAQGHPPGVILELLEDENPENFSFTAAGAYWREKYFINAPQIEYLRRRYITSFGSCSFTEPVEELQDLELLNKEGE